MVDNPEKKIEVFICYARGEKNNQVNIISKLKLALSADCNVWWDENNFATSGTTFESFVIERIISSDFAIVIVNYDLINKHDGVARAIELKEILAKWNDKSRTRPFHVIPLLDDTIILEDIGAILFDDLRELLKIGNLPSENYQGQRSFAEKDESTQNLIVTQVKNRIYYLAKAAPSDLAKNASANASSAFSPNAGKPIQKLENGVPGTSCSLLWIGDTLHQLSVVSEPLAMFSIYPISECTTMQAGALAVDIDGRVAAWVHNGDLRVAWLNRFSCKEPQVWPGPPISLPPPKNGESNWRILAVSMSGNKDIEAICSTDSEAIHIRINQAVVAGARHQLTEIYAAGNKPFSGSVFFDRAVRGVKQYPRFAFIELGSGKLSTSELDLSLQVIEHIDAGRVSGHVVYAAIGLKQNGDRKLEIRKFSDGKQFGRPESVSLSRNEPLLGLSVIRNYSNETGCIWLHMVDSSRCIELIKVNDEKK